MSFTTPATTIDFVGFEESVITDYRSRSGADRSGAGATMKTSSTNGLFIVPDMGDEDLGFPAGSVLNSQGKLICPVLPTPSEEVGELETHDIQSLIFKEALDGTLLRVFFHEGTWRLATALSLDVERVNQRFGHTKSFAVMFQEALEGTEAASLELLKPGYSYFFILQHPENSMIVQHIKPSLVHIATLSVRDSAPWYRDHPEMILEGAGQKVLTFSSIKDMSNAMDDLDLESSDAPCARVGVIISQQQDDGTILRWRQNTTSYTAIKKYRGRFSDVRYRLLQIICDKTMDDDEKESKLRDFITVFPHYTKTLVDLDKDLNRLYKVAYAFYVMYFIRRSPTVVFHPDTGAEIKETPDRELVESHFIRFLHRFQREVYYACRRRMQDEDIADFILVQDPPQVLHLLNGLRVVETYPPEELEEIAALLQ